MKILCTMPGKYGDILWALPTVRALSEGYGQAVDLVVSPRYGAIVPLLQDQPYIGEAWADADWDVQDTAPMTPRTPPDPSWDRVYDRVYHLGYEGWPEGTLAEDLYRRAKIHWWPAPTPTGFPPLDLARPWITTPTLPPPPLPLVEWPEGQRRHRIVLGWSEEWFELKVGLSLLLAKALPEAELWWIRPWGGRYDEIDRDQLWPAGGGSTRVLPPNLGIVRAGWQETALFFAWADLYVGCLSSAWVLANALGKRCVVVEPNPQRHHPVFWADGGGKNRLVRGIDGQPTFDARHLADAVRDALGVIHAPVST